jgi:hypothetical protein
MLNSIGGKLENHLPENIAVTTIIIALRTITVTNITI